MKYLLCSVSVILIAVNVFSQAPQVIGTNPISQSLITAPNDLIVITFDQPLNEATVTPDTFRVFGRWSGPMDGTYSFSAGSTVVKFTPVRNFFYGEWVRVGLSNGIQNTTGIPLTNGYGFNFWTKALPASLDLELVGQIDMRLPGEGAITCYGAYAGDVNNDEFSDLVVITEDSDDIRVLLHDGSNGYDPFIVIELPPVQGPSTNEGADFNNDGLIDMAIGSTWADQVNVLLGDAGTIFGSQMNYQTGEGVRGLAIADLNGDGWDDIVTANRAASTISILMNDGTGIFEPAVNIDSGFDGETSIAATDLNDDGYVDLLVAAYDGNRLVSLLNDGTGNFTVFDSVTSGGNPWMIAIGDVNGDGFVDVAVANSTSHNIAIVRTDGSGGLQFDRYYAVGDFPVAIDLGDIDGDGDLDFISSNFNGPNYILMENDGSGTFVNPRIYPSPFHAACATIHDRNNDGAMDISMIDEGEDVVLLYNNTLSLGDDGPVADMGLTLYPNPFNYIIYVSGTIIGPVRLELYDVNGRQLFSRYMGNSKQFDIGEIGLSEGIYIAKLFHNGNTQKIKMYKTSQN
ncbi:MAG: FG-GAP-like repeat-containing protein [Bacteroidetes bacterium]|nr:FG-GAP-like repeat-containing protein [Bacteroidota bacterium]